MIKTLGKIRGLSKLKAGAVNALLKPMNMSYPNHLGKGKNALTYIHTYI